MIVLQRPPTPFFFSAVDEARFLATGVIHCTGTEAPSAALRRRFGVPSYVAPRMARRIEQVSHLYSDRAMNG